MLPAYRTAEPTVAESAYAAQNLTLRVTGSSGVECPASRLLGLCVECQDRERRLPES
jgi:hypothetical protein